MQKTNNIYEKDYQLICDVVTHYPNHTFSELEKILQNIFLTDICSQHFIMLGIAIGERSTALNQIEYTNKLLSLCQRQN
jgi:hypothetical protein